MRTFWKSLAAAAAVAGAPLLFGGFASAAPMMKNVQALDTASVEQVQWRGRRGGWRGGWRGPGWVGPGIVGGAIIGGAIASDYYYGYGTGFGYAPGYIDDDDVVVVEPGRSRDDAYCSRRFRSYDPASGTYMGYDGLRHPCP